MTLAFALAGLGGFNAHGAGFLQAARDSDVRPDLVTATSGQIVVLAAYLAGKPDLKKDLIDPALKDDKFAQLRTLLFGYRGVFEPATAEAWARLVTPPWFGTDISFYADKLLPAQVYKPTRSDEVIDGIADTFNHSEIGVVFNAYDPVAGTGRLFGNERARALLPEESNVPVLHEQYSSDPRLGHQGPREEAILPIDAEAVKAALWLSLYGFAGMPMGLIDGAYHRSCIVSELHTCDDLFVCRPLAKGWGKEGLPRSYFDVQDWNTEMWFSVGYKAEIDAMKRINSLIRDERMKAVDMREIEPETPAGYFNYFIEREAVFQRAYDDAMPKFAAYKTGRAAR